MKTILKSSKTFLTSLTLILILASNIANAQERTRLYTGLRLPQMTTDERTKIGAEALPQHARGQLIFNTDTEMLEYWSGEAWVAINEHDSVLQHIINNVTQEFTDSIMAKVRLLSADSSVTITGSGTSAIDLSVNIAKIVQELIDNSTFVENMITNIAGDTTFVNLLMNNAYFIQEVITNLTENKEFITNIVDSIATHVTQELVDSIMTNVSITGERGLVVTGSGTSKISITLPEGQNKGQILTWDTAAKVWTAAAPAQTVRQLTIPVENGDFTTESLVFYGVTSASVNPLKVVNIEPVFSDNQQRRIFLSVDASVIEQNNAAEWTVSVENRNFSPDNQFVLTSVIISYISADVQNLNVGTQDFIQIMGF